MNNLKWYDKISKFVEGHPGLGDIKYGQLKLIAEFVAKEEREIDFENIVREAVTEWVYSGRLGSARGIELLVSEITARLESGK